MKFLSYALAFIFLDAIVPKSCRGDNAPDFGNDLPQYEELIGQHTHSIEVTYYDSSKPQYDYWDVLLTADSAVLSVGSDQIEVIHLLRPCDSLLFCSLKDSLQAMVNHSFSYGNLADTLYTSMGLNLCDSTQNYFWGFHHTADTLAEYNFNGDLSGIRRLCASLFSEQFQALELPQ